MTSPTGSVEVRMGALADPILDQLSAQGLMLTSPLKDRVQKDADAITRLVIGELITDSVARKARHKLFKRIMKDLRGAK